MPQFFYRKIHWGGAMILCRSCDSHGSANLEDARPGFTPQRAGGYELEVGEVTMKSSTLIHLGTLHIVYCLLSISLHLAVIFVYVLMCNMVLSPNFHGRKQNVLL